MAKAFLMRPLEASNAAQCATMSQTKTTGVEKATQGNAMMRKSSTCWKLSDLVAPTHEATTVEPEHSHAVVFQKPPRHSNVPSCAQALVTLWQELLQRRDVTLTSDFFDDLEGSDEQAVELVERMQQMGYHISRAQFFALDRCTIYAVLVVAL